MRPSPAPEPDGPDRAHQ
ncbi:hypothetical protein YPPY19_2913, partial [Yersinia pestis PY-19]